MTGAGVVIEGTKRVSHFIAPSLTPVIAGPLETLQRFTDPLDMAGFQEKRKKAQTAGARAAQPVISGPAMQRRKATLKSIKARAAADKSQDAEIAMMKRRWADLSDDVSKLSERLEADGKDSQADALAAVALKLAENAKNPPPGPQADLASNVSDEVKSLMADMYDMVNRTTEDPDFSSIVARLENPASSFLGDPDEDSISYSIDTTIDEAIAYADPDMYDNTFDGQLPAIAGPGHVHGNVSKTPKTPKELLALPAGQERAIVAGCCSSCSIGKGPCASTLGGEGVPGEYTDFDDEGSMFGPDVDDIDEDDIIDTEEDMFEENLGNGGAEDFGW